MYGDLLIQRSHQHSVTKKTCPTASRFVTAVCHPPRKWAGHPHRNSHLTSATEKSLSADGYWFSETSTWYSTYFDWEQMELLIFASTFGKRIDRTPRTLLRLFKFPCTANKSDLLSFLRTRECLFHSHMFLSFSFQNAGTHVIALTTAWRIFSVKCFFRHCVFGESGGGVAWVVVVVVGSSLFQGRVVQPLVIGHQVSAISYQLSVTKTQS